MLAAASPLLTRLLPPVLPAQAQAGEWRHALSLFGEIKYPAGFKQFDYVNANAPKGGSVRMGAQGTFDNFNVAVGVVKGNLARGLNLVFDSLAVPSLDEVSTDYGLLCEAVLHPPDFSWVIYRLRPQARFHDGKPVTADDVIFSFDTLKKYDPQQAAYYRHVVKAEKTSGEGEVKFTFDGPGNR